MYALYSLVQLPEDFSWNTFAWKTIGVVSGSAQNEGTIHYD